MFSVSNKTTTKAMKMYEKAISSAEKEEIDLMRKYIKKRDDFIKYVNKTKDELRALKAQKDRLKVKQGALSR